MAGGDGRPPQPPGTSTQVSLGSRGWRKLMRRMFALVLLAVPVFLSSAGRAADTPTMSQPSGLIANVEHRKTISLNGTWHYIVDPYDNGYYDYRHQPRKDGFFQNEKPKTPRDLVEYDFDKSDTIQVPGDWNSQKKELFYYEGTVWYQRAFTYRKPASGRVFLYIGAANYLSRLLSLIHISEPTRL